MVSEKGMLRIWGGGEENQGRSESQIQAKEEPILPAVWTLTRSAFAFAQNGNPAEARAKPWSCRSENMHRVNN
jgi:hypothetical protein